MAAAIAFKGIKYVHDDRRLDLVADTTTLFVELVESGGTGNKARGVLKIRAADFAKQVRTLKGTGGAIAARAHQCGCQVRGLVRRPVVRHLR